MKRAWLLHALLIASLIFTPGGKIAPADGEDGYVFEGEYESEVQVSVSAPGGTDGLTPGETRQVLADVQIITWEIWRNAEYGTSERRNPITQPSLTNVTFRVLEPGRGSVDADAKPTDINGIAVATFTPGPGISVVEALVAGTGATGSVTFSAEAETWLPVREERLLSASLSADAATDGVGNGETRQVTVSAQYQTWTIYRSNYGAEEPRDFGNTPAIGAQIDWSIAEGDGSLATVATSSPTNGQGLASANLTMADARTVVRADVTFAETDQTYATLTFTPLETWAKSNISETIPSLSLSVAGSTDELAPGNQRLVTANVLGEYYDLYVSNFGNTKWEYSHTAPLQGAQIGFSIIAGDGFSLRTTGFTDADGNLTTSFTMGHQFYTLQAQLDNMTTTVDFSPVPEVFTYQRTYDVLSLDWVRVDGGPSNGVPKDEIRTLSAGVIVSTYDLYVSNLGNERADLIASGPASGASVGFTVTSGDGILSAESAIADENGDAGVGFTMGRQSVVVHVEVAGNGADLQLSCPPPQWTFSHREMTVSVEMSANGSFNEVPDRAVRTVNAHATFEKWEVWVNALNEDETEVRNNTSGAADGATVEFSIEGPSDGQLTNAATRTNATGDATATFTMGTQTARVWAVVGFGGAESASSLEFSPDGWVYSHPGQDVNLSLSADEAAVTAYVFIRNWDVYVNGEETQERNHAVSPGIHAPVTFTGGGGVSVATGTTQTANNGRAGTTYTVTSGTVGTITVQASLLGALLEDTITVDTDADGLPDALEQRYAGTLVGLDPDEIRTFNGQTDGLTWGEAYESGSLDRLRNLNVTEVALRSSVIPDGYDIPNGTYRREIRPTTPAAAHFACSGTGTYTVIDEETGEVIHTYNDVLRTDVHANSDNSEREEYEEKKALPNAPWNSDDAVWREGWQDNTVVVLDGNGDPVSGDDGLPLRHGSWSGRRYYYELVENTTFHETGVIASNDRFATVPSPAPHVSTSNVRAGRVYGSETYYFTDSGNDPNPYGILDPEHVTRAQFAAIRNTWLTMAPPDEAARQSPDYPPNTSAVVASSSVDGNYESRRYFWIRTADFQPAPRPLIRNYVLLNYNQWTTSSMKVQLIIPTGQVSSPPISLFPEPGYTQKLCPVEFKAMWETDNPANRIFNPTQKHDPAASPNQRPDSLDNVSGTPLNQLYVVADPIYGVCDVTVALNLGGVSGFVAAVYNGDSKEPFSDAPVPTSGEVELLFTPNTMPQTPATIKVGYDANSNQSLDPNEAIFLHTPANFSKTFSEQPKIVAVSKSSYDYYHSIKAWAAYNSPIMPGAKNAFRVFFDGNSSGVESPRPGGPNLITFNAFSSPYSEWLTHNSGSQFDEDGINEQFPEYNWEPTTAVGIAVGNSYTARKAAMDYFNRTLRSRVRSDLSNTPIGNPPVDYGTHHITGSYPHESTTAFVDRTTVIFDNPVTPNLIDEENAAVGRGRLHWNDVRFTAEKTVETVLSPSGLPVNRTVILVHAYT